MTLVRTCFFCSVPPDVGRKDCKIEVYTSTQVWIHTNKFILYLACILNIWRNYLSKTAKWCSIASVLNTLCTAVYNSNEHCAPPQRAPTIDQEAFSVTILQPFLEGLILVTIQVHVQILHLQDDIPQSTCWMIFTGHCSTKKRQLTAPTLLDHLNLLPQY